MIRTVVSTLFLVTVLFSCAHLEQRSPRYDPHQCPICQNATDGTCTYCNGTKECMFCKGKKERLTVVPNRTGPGIKKISYIMKPCPYCEGTGVCTYCKGSGKCWTCNGTGKVSDKWVFLVSRKPAPLKITE
jgi:RecJ-like exonuclease